MDIANLIKMHKAEGNPAKQGLLIRLKAEDDKSQAANRAALLAQRAADGLASAVCPKCGAESVFDAANKAPKCGAMVGSTEVKGEGGTKHTIPAPCGTLLKA